MKRSAPNPGKGASFLHETENLKSDLYETTVNGFFDLKNTHTSTKINKIGCKVGYLTENVYFKTPTNLSDLVF